MQWKTAISKIEDNSELVRGYSLSELVGNKTFVESIFLLWKGEMPSVNETKMLNALFTAAIDHGVGVASTMSARLSASAGNSLHASLAAGILSLGTRHGLAIEGAAKFFQENLKNPDIETTLKNLKEQKVRIPGFGHRILQEDKRAIELFKIAKELGQFGAHAELSETVGKILNQILSKPLPINIDGAMAAIISDMGFDWRMAQGFFITARVPGLIAHIYEETVNGEGLRRLSSEEEEYIGPAQRNILI